MFVYFLKSIDYFKPYLVRMNTDYKVYINRKICKIDEKKATNEIFKRHYEDNKKQICKKLH